MAARGFDHHAARGDAQGPERRQRVGTFTLCILPFFFGMERPEDRNAQTSTCESFLGITFMKNSTDRVGFCVPLAAMIIAVSCTSSAPSTTPSPLGNNAAAVRRVVVLGDSLAVSPTRDQSFPAALQARIDQQGLPWKVTNAGIGGDTTSGGLRRIDALIADSDVGILIVALGANDGLRGVDTVVIERNLATMIERAQARRIRVLLCGMEAPPVHGWDYTVAFHRVFPRLAQKYGVPLVPFLLTGVALVPDMNGSDGVHPNAAGAQRIAATVWPYLEPIVRQDAAVTH